jgi:hypothetical protein
MISQYKYILPEPLYMFRIIRATVRYIKTCNLEANTTDSLSLSKLEGFYTYGDAKNWKLTILIHRYGAINTTLIILLGSYRTAQQTCRF